MKKLAFLISFAVLSQGFCCSPYAETVSTDDQSVAVQKVIAGNASKMEYSHSENKVAYYAPHGNDLIADNNKSENEALTKYGFNFLNSIPETEKSGSDGFSTYLQNIHCTYSDAISEIKFKNSTLLESDEQTSSSTIAVEDNDADNDELTSGSSTNIGNGNTNSIGGGSVTEQTTDEITSEGATSIGEETQTTTTDGRSSRRASYGGGNSSGKAARGVGSDGGIGTKKSDDSTNDDRNSTTPDNRGTDTPDTSRNLSDNDNGGFSENTGHDKDDDKPKVDIPNDDSLLDGGHDKGNNGHNYDYDFGDDNYDLDGVNNVDTTTSLPQTGSMVDTGFVTLCGLALIAFGAVMITRKRKSM